MYNFRKSLKTLAGLLVLLGITAAITPFTGHSQDATIEPTAASDVRVINTAASPALTKVVNPVTAPVPTRNVDGARGSNLVMLSCSFTICKRVFSTGTTSADEFVVPAGQVLVVTDVNWEAHCDTCSSGGVRLFLGVAQATVYVSTITLNSNGVGSTSETMNTGFAAAAGRKVKTFVDFSGISGAPDRILLRGYLVPAV